jgi:glutaredoxin
MGATITLFTRKQCSLCDKAYAAIERVRAQHPFDLTLVDLDTEASPEKLAAYTFEVPVLELSGRKIMKLRVDEARLLRLVRDGDG